MKKSNIFDSNARTVADPPNTFKPILSLSAPCPGLPRYLGSPASQMARSQAHLALRILTAD